MAVAKWVLPVPGPPTSTTFWARCHKVAQVQLPYQGLVDFAVRELEAGRPARGRTAQSAPGHVFVGARAPAGANRRIHVDAGVSRRADDARPLLLVRGRHGQVRNPRAARQCD